MLVKAKKKKDEEKIWQKWVSSYPFMSKDGFIPFEEFLRKHEPLKKSSESEKQKAIERAERIRKEMKKK